MLLFLPSTILYTYEHELRWYALELTQCLLLIQYLSSQPKQEYHIVNLFKPCLTKDLLEEKHNDKVLLLTVLSDIPNNIKKTFGLCGSYLWGGQLNCKRFNWSFDATECSSRI